MSNDSRCIITVCICTYNRSHMLGNLLSVIGSQTLPAEQFEILIVDNSDNLQDRDSFYTDARLPANARVLYSEPPGLSRARNVGVQHCSTPYIAFIDDDAEPCPEWLRELLNAFHAFESVHAVGGRIDPIWTTGRPSWLPKAYEGCLTILDLGNELRKLSPEEYIYGTNMAFRTEILKDPAVFNEDLGRRGSGALLSNEEMQVMHHIRQAGGNIVYNPRALVHHRVHQNRVSQSWIKRRIAWQAVSDILAEQARPRLSDLRESLRWNLDRLDIPKRFLYPLLGPTRDPAELRVQIDTVYQLMLYILGEMQDGDGVVDADTEGAVAALLAGKRAFHNGAYMFPVHVHPQTQCLFFEAARSHQYLFDLYGDLANVQLVAKDGLLEGNGFLENVEEFLRYSIGHIHGAIQAIFFLTMCPFLYGESSAILKKYLRGISLKKTGILHTFPHTEEQIAAFREICSCIDVVFMFSDIMVEDARNRFQVENVFYLPQHPLYASRRGNDKARLRRMYGIPEEAIVFTFLGEARPGAGIEVLAEALDLIPHPHKGRIYVNVSGEGRPGYIAADVLKEALGKSGISGRVDLRRREDNRVYGALTDAEFLDNILLTDFGLLPYNGPDRYRMSRVLPDMVYRGIPVIASEDSYVGKTVSRYGLGVTYEKDAPSLLSREMASAVESYGNALSEARYKFLEEIAPAHVLSELERHIL
jgi:glycosyltransferase involved in cell wall biosynthesis